MGAKGGPVFTFSLPGERPAPLPRQLRHWSEQLTTAISGCANVASNKSIERVRLDWLAHIPVCKIASC